MTLFNKLIGFAALAVLTFSCKKDVSTEDTKLPANIETNWEFTESGTVYKGDTDSAYIKNDPGISLLTLEGSGMPEKNGKIILQIIDDDLAPGPYNSPQVFFQYAENGVVVFENIPTDESFIITILSLDSASVTGTFTGTVQDSQGNQRSITNGKFTGTLGYGLIIEPPVENNEYLPLQVGAVWSYYDELDPSQTQSITDVELGIERDYRFYHKFVSSLGEEKYYRKEDSVYYEFRVLDFGLPVTYADSGDIAILRENYDVGQEWESFEFNITLGGIPLKAKLISSISQKNYSASFSGTEYNNLIDVRTELYLSANGGESFDYSGNSYLTTFAKGIGIVYYIDLANSSQWIIADYKL